MEEVWDPQSKLVLLSATNVSMTEKEQQVSTGTTLGRKEGRFRRSSRDRDCGTAAGMSVAWFPGTVTGLSPAPRPSPHNIQ